MVTAAIEHVLVKFLQPYVSPRDDLSGPDLISTLIEAKVDGIDSNDLRLSLWSGNLELKDLKALGQPDHGVFVHFRNEHFAFVSIVRLAKQKGLRRPCAGQGRCSRSPRRGRQLGSSLSQLSEEIDTFARCSCTKWPCS